MALQLSAFLATEAEGESEGAFGRAAVFEVRPLSSTGWTVSTSSQVCEAGESESEQVEAACPQNLACFVSWSADEVPEQWRPAADEQGNQTARMRPPPSVKGVCGDVKFEQTESLPLREWHFNHSAPDRTFEVMSRRKMLIQDHDVALLVLFSSAGPTRWLIDMHVNGYSAGAVCGQGEFGDSLGLRATIPPFIVLPLAINSTVTSTPLGYNVTRPDGTNILMPVGVCKQCQFGSLPESWADSTCYRVCRKGWISSNGLKPCVACSRNYYSDELGLSCKKCDSDRPYTNTIGAASADECWFADVGVEYVRSVGRKLEVAAFATLRPSSLARAADIVALFKDEPSSEEPWRQGYERQVAWSYTSYDHSPRVSDDSAGFPGMLPGTARVDRWSHTFLFPSAGPGMYTLKFFSNSSNQSDATAPWVPEVSVEHGAVRALLHFRLLVAARVFLSFARRVH